MTAVETAPGPVWVDNHCHLDGCLPAVDGDGEPPAVGSDRAVAAVLEEAAEAGVRAVISVGTDLQRSAAAVELASRVAGVWATVGVHPHDAAGGIAGVEGLARAGRDEGTVVAVGECGLDYHYDHSPRPVQREVFAEQVRLAHELELPLVVHTREAWDDTFDVLTSEGVPSRTVFHCFTGGPAEAERCLATGALLSVSGIVTFPSATELREAVAAAPLDRLLVETDSPYLAPVPHRGRRNRPALVARVGEEVAALLGRPVGEVAAATTATAVACYGIVVG
jgi:TatD DNase family protein